MSSCAANADGTTVRVKDVARVELGAQDYSIAARIDGQPAAAIAIRLAPGANALDTAKAVKAKMTELAKYFPKGIDWVVPYDTSKFVEISITRSGDDAGRSDGAGVPGDVPVPGKPARHPHSRPSSCRWRWSARAVGLYAFGYSINMLTLFAMVLAIGIVVDDAIVVVENVERIMTRGRSAAARRHAQGDGADHQRHHRHHAGAVGGVRADGFLRRLGRRDLPPVRGHAGADHRCSRC